MTVAILCLIAAVLPGEIPVTSRSPKAAELLREGRAKLLDLEASRAQKLLREAVALDPDFPLGLAWLGRAVGGSEGLSLVERAVSLGAALPPAERLQIDVLMAERRGEEDRARRLKRQLADMAPRDWLPQLMQGVQAQYDRKSQSAIHYLQRCLQLNPKQGAAYNYLAYVYLGQGMLDEAVDTARKLTLLRPEDSNPQDSLGEMLLRSGRLDEADAAFARSVELAADNWMAWTGRAYVQFFRGQAGAGREMLRHARANTESAQARRMIDVVVAWSQLAQGAVPAALAGIDELERTAKAHKDQVSFAWAALQRGEMLAELGRSVEARAQLSDAFARAQGIPGEDANRLRRLGLLTEQRAALSMNDAKAASAAVSAIDALAAKATENPLMRNAAFTAHGLEQLAAGKAAEAARTLSQCTRTAFRCQWALAEAQERAGERASAQETRAWIATANVRDAVHHSEDPVYLYLRERLLHPGALAAR